MVYTPPLWGGIQAYRGLWTPPWGGVSERVHLGPKQAKKNNICGENDPQIALIGHAEPRGTPWFCIQGGPKRTIFVGEKKALFWLSDIFGGLFWTPPLRGGGFELFWPFLGYFGHFWAILDIFGLFWPFLGYFGPFWAIQASKRGFSMAVRTFWAKQAIWGYSLIIYTL